MGFGKTLGLAASLAAAGLAGCAVDGDPPDPSWARLIQSHDLGDSTQRSSFHFITPLWQDSGFVAAWETDHLGAPYTHGLAIAELDPTGNTVSLHTVTNADSIKWREPRVSAFPGGGYVVAWYSQGPTILQGEAYFQIFRNRSASGGPVHVELPGVQWMYSVSVAALPDTGFVLAASVHDSAEGSGFLVLRFNAAGKPVGAPQRIATETDASHAEVIGLPSGGWMIAWKTEVTGRIVAWQPFDAHGEPFAEARTLQIHEWFPRFLMRNFPDERVYIDLDSPDSGMVVDALGAPDPRFESMTIRFGHGLIPDAIHGGYYGLTFDHIIAYDADGNVRGNRSTQVSGFWDGRVFLNRESKLVLFSRETKEIKSTGHFSDFIKCMVLEPF